MAKLIDRRKTKTAGNKIAKATSRRRFLKGAAVAAAARRWSSRNYRGRRPCLKR